MKKFSIRSPEADDGATTSATNATSSEATFAASVTDETSADDALDTCTVPILKCF